MSTWSDLWPKLNADNLNEADRAGLIEELHTAYLALPRAGVIGGLPYPSPTDPIAQGADAIRALAEAISPRLPVKWARGRHAFPTIGPQASANTAIVFPAGTFTETPWVTLIADTSRVVLSVFAPALAGFTFVAQNLSTANAPSFNGQWVAFQLPPGVLDMGGTFLDPPSGKPVDEEGA